MRERVPTQAEQGSVQRAAPRSPGPEVASVCTVGERRADGGHGLSAHRTPGAGVTETSPSWSVRGVQLAGLADATQSTLEMGVVCDASAVGLKGRVRNKTAGREGASGQGPGRGPATFRSAS